MRASVVLEPGTVPNCRGSICLSTDGLTKRSTTTSSAAVVKTAFVANMAITTAACYICYMCKSDFSSSVIWRGLTSERSTEGVCLHRGQAFVSGLG